MIYLKTVELAWLLEMGLLLELGWLLEVWELLESALSLSIYLMVLNNLLLLWMFSDVLQ